jgi:hypothetical protein
VTKPAPIPVPPPPGGNGGSDGGIKVGPEDVVRWRVMYITIGIFALTVLLALVAGLWSDKPNTEHILARPTPEDRRLAKELEEVPFDHLKQLLQILLPAETALLG